MKPLKRNTERASLRKKRELEKRKRKTNP